MNTKTAGETIQEVVSSITNSKWAKSVIPTVEELNQTISNNTRLSKSFIDEEEIRKSVARRLNTIGMNTEEANNAVKKININTFEADIDKLNLDSDKTEKLKKATKIAIEKEKGRISYNVENMNILDKIIKYPQAYFANPDKSIKNTRISTAIGGYTALSVGGRYLQGGTLTRDEYGRKDIAGIPFL